MITVAPPCTPAPELTVPEFLESNPYHNCPEQVVYIDAATGETVTWQEYIGFSRRLATGLRFHLGAATSNKIVAILSPNQLHYPMTYIGVMGAGFVPSPISPAATAAELRTMLAALQPQGIIVHPELYALLLQALKANHTISKPTIMSIVKTDPNGLLTIFQLAERGEHETLPFEGLKGKPAGETLALIPFSSGTTGAFKGVMLSHRNIISNVLQLKQGWADYWDPKPMALSFLADYHSYSHTQICIVNPVSGMTTVRMQKYNFEDLLQAIEKYKIAALPIVPPVAVQLAKDPLTSKYDLSSIKRIMIAAAATKPSIVRLLRQKFGASVVQSFGCTEVSPTSHVLPAYMEHFDGSVGKLLPGMECRLVDPDTGRVVGLNEEGEFQYRGPNVMMGYYHNPKATEEAFTQDGWLKSGDIGYRNSDGLFWCTDRIKEMIKVNGYQVSPAELESIILSHEKVIDAAVKRGIAEKTELPVAFVVVSKEDRTEAMKQSIHELVGKNVAHYKRLGGGIVWMDESRCLPLDSVRVVGTSADTLESRSPQEP